MSSAVSNLANPTLDLPSSLSKLPPFPRVALRALNALSSEDLPAKAIEDVIASDVVFASSALHCANSALFALPSRVVTLRHAIVVLGRERLRCLILTTALQSFVKAPLRSKDFRSWWHHSLATALLSEAFAKVSREDCPEAYMAGLLHDVGRLGLILQLSRENWRAFLRSAEAPTRANMTILEIERDVFGIDHCAIGVRLLSEWGLPAELVEAARLHHETDFANSRTSSILVAGACEMSSAIGFEALKYPRRRPVADFAPLFPTGARPLLSSDPDKLRVAINEKIQTLA